MIILFDSMIKIRYNFETVRDDWWLEISLLKMYFGQMFCIRKNRYIQNREEELQ